MLDPQLIAARWYVTELSSEEMPAIACHALELGYDGKSLRRLAGLSSPTRREIEEIVAGALQEMSVDAPMTKRDAANWMARRVAREISDGGIEPYQGACRIWLSYSSDAPELGYWSELATDFEIAADIGNPEEARRQIIQAATDLLTGTDFRATVERFRTLLEQNRYSRNIIWLKPKDVLFSGERFVYVRIPVATSSFQKAFDTYRRGMALGRGLLLTTVCEIDNATACFVWYPERQEAVPQGIWPHDGSVKLSVKTGASRIPGRLIKNPMYWEILKLRTLSKQNLKGFLFE